LRGIASESRVASPVARSDGTCYRTIASRVKCFVRLSPQGARFLRDNDKTTKRGLRVSSQTQESGGLAERYSRALFDLADEQRVVDPIAKDLDSLAAMIDGSPDLGRLIRSPVISRADQLRAMAALVDAADMHPLTGKFIGLLARNRRLFILPAIIRAFRRILARRRGETAAEVTSAQKLSAAQLADLAAQLKKAIGTDVLLADRVDPSILGGLVVRVGSRMVDSSLRTKLQRLRLAMKGVG
jgi:F-type H+-transporting ATPase subunit delta